MVEILDPEHETVADSNQAMLGHDPVTQVIKALASQGVVQQVVHHLPTQLEGPEPIRHVILLLHRAP
jgi:hypothetical protein